jgi:6,7-dimethyl-8-ribityllumazine synthase
MMDMSFPELDGTEVRVGIIKTREYEGMSDALVTDVKAALSACGVNAENVIESEVPDAFQLPLAVRFLAMSGQVDVVVPVGALIKEGSADFDAVVDTVTKALNSISLQMGVPVIRGLTAAETEAQAASLAGKEGAVLGKSAVEMALLRQSVTGKKNKFFLGFGEDDEAEAPTVAPAATGTGLPTTKKVGF